MKTSCSRAILAAALVASLLVHGGLYAAVLGLDGHGPKPRDNAPIAFEVVHAPPQPQPVPPPPPAVTAPEPALHRVARLPMPLPNAPLPVSAPTPSKPPIVHLGISMGSTTSGGALAVPVGNSLMGQVAEVAPAPADVQPSRPAPFVPVTRLSTPPRILEQPKVVYPPQARAAQIEGQVMLKLRIDERGRVIGVELLDGPGYGLNEAAAEAARTFRFAPATRDGEPVGTEIRFTYTFLLE